MSRPILTDELWQRVVHVLPPTPPRRRVPGPHPLPDRAVLGGILFVLKTGVPWQELPAEVGAGSGMTCLRRLRQWQREGTWERIHRTLAAAFGPNEIDWRRADRPPRVRRRGVPADRVVRAALSRPRAGTAPTFAEVHEGPQVSGPEKPRGGR